MSPPRWIANQYDLQYKSELEEILLLRIELLVEERVEHVHLLSKLRLILAQLIQPYPTEWSGEERPSSDANPHT